MSVGPGPWGIYVHVPWCRRRCPYCAFYVEVDRDVPWDAFVDRVLAEHQVRAPAFGERADTIFLGGGTPSRLPGPALSRLLSGLPHVDDAEVTVETNPEDAEEAWLDDALASGVTRVSLGIQTFDPRFARLLNRASSVNEARDCALRVARAGLHSWSVDVIFALPGQSTEDLRVDLDAILAVDPPHVSLYGLTFEPNTPFGQAADAGRMRGPDGDAWRAQYDLLVETLEGHGLLRYEVSNFARPGHESRHNRLHWTDRPYCGLGPSAHGYAPDGRRWRNVADIGRYLEAGDPTETLERPDPRAAAVDLVLSSLRAREGLDRGRLRSRTGLDVDDGAASRLVAAGWLAMDGDRLRLTASGFPIADAVTERLCDALQEVPP